MQFTKMHGLGNDYVYLNLLDHPDAIADPQALAVQMSDRHRGVGSDGLILILPADPGAEAHVRMRMFNADGSEGEMCGNGIRCVCKLVHDHGLNRAQPLRVQTAAGILSLDYTTDRAGKVEAVTVDMGPPILELAHIPVSADRLDESLADLTFVSMGNPHAVQYVDAIDRDTLLARGAKLEHHRAFPNRMNLHFVQVHGKDEVTVLHWERGSGPTLACGTGACAVCVAGVLTGKTSRSIIAHLPGGDLHLRWCEASDHVFMTGPATEVFTGRWPS